MRKLYIGAATIAAALALQGCVSTPMGPTVPVYPGQGKSFSDFQADQAYCENYAENRVAGRVNRSNDEIARNTVIGTALGAAFGAAVGDTSGAIAGGVAGGAIGASTASPGHKQYSTQRAYNIAYAQCMKYRGNEIEARRPGWDHRYRDYPPPPPPPPPYGYPDD